MSTIGKNIKKFRRGSEGAAEGGCGGNSAAPERIEPRHLPEYLEGRTPKKNVLSIFRKNPARANPNSKRHFSLVSAEALRGGGGAGQFPSKKVRAKDIISPPIETSRFERIAPRGREAAALRKTLRRFVANWLGGLNSKRADLSVSYLKTI